VVPEGAATRAVPTEAAGKEAEVTAVVATEGETAGVAPWETAVGPPLNRRTSRSLLS